MKKLIYIALAIFTLTACSNEDDFSKSSSNKKEIGFMATIGSNTRASSGFCVNNKPGQIKVWACVPEGSGFKPYFEEDVFTIRSNDDDFYTTSQGRERYWPDSDVRFYAFPFAGCGVYFNPMWTSDGSTMEFDFTNQEMPEDQYDLIYAASGDTQGSDYNGSVYTNLFFRHALTQIEFKAKTEVANYYIEVGGVKITNIKNGGHYVLPTKTDNWYTNHSTYPGNDYRTSRGTWSNLTGSVNCEASFDPVAFVMSDGAVSLTEKDSETYGNSSGAGTATSDQVKEYNKNTMYLIPQDARSNGKIVLMVKIWKMSDPSVGHQATDQLVYGTSSAYAEKEFIIPNIWDEGKHYIYTLVIGDDDDDKIKFSVNVDDYDLNSNEVLTY
ncbi:MAG: fimbrillin family protein [Lepagella sp.]